MFAEAPQKHHVNYLQDVATILSNRAFHGAIKSIPGQRSGISLSYFFMLSGSDDLVKEDRWPIPRAVAFTREPKDTDSSVAVNHMCRGNDFR